VTSGAVIVTGGTSGIGLSIVRRLVSAGHDVYALSRSDHGFGPAVADVAVGDLAGHATYVKGDVCDRGSLQALAVWLEAGQVELRAVVAAAGIAIRSPALEMPDADVRRMLDVNLYGTIATFQVFAPLALARPGARFIAISSISGRYGMSLRAVYGATKAGIAGLVRSLAIEWAPYGATVNAVGPGVIVTPLTAGYLEQHPERAQALFDHTPVNRIGTPEDVSHVVAFLMSPESGFITGQTVYTDGGLIAGCSWW
jgi:NAD(P)-dependent dehydrogenase (short-subunit alcohol dehydrogenase family)